MTIDCQCVGCGADFEVDPAELMEEGETIECPSCEATADPSTVEDLLAAIHELTTCVAALRRKFSLSVAIESERVAREVTGEEDEEVEADDDDDDDDDDADGDDDGDDDADDDRGRDQDDE